MKRQTSDTKGGKKKARRTGMPLFDMYGQNPSFLIYGEDSHGTTFGCILSIAVVVLMLSVTSFYTWRFLVKGEVQMSETTTSGTTFNTLDLKAGKFFLSVNYRRQDKLEEFGEIEDRLLRVRVSMVTVTKSDEKGVEPEYDIEDLDLNNCDEEFPTTSEYQGQSSAIGADSRCVRFKSSGLTTISGGLGTSNWKFLEISVEPCDPSEPTCITSKFVTPGLHYNMAAGDAQPGEVDLFKTAFDQFQDLSLHFNLMSASSDLNNYTDPISYNINTNHQLKIDMHNKKTINFYLGSYEVQSKYGWFYPFSTSVTSVHLADTFMDGTHRDVTSKSFTYHTGEGTTKQWTQPYMVIRVLSSTVSTTIEREYETMIDVFGNVGGVAEALTFLIAILLFCHSDVRYEQRILNDGLLQETEEMEQFDGGHKDEQMSLNPTRTKTVRRMEFDSTGQQQEVTKIYELDKRRVRYGYWELFSFKYCCGCCTKKHTVRKEEYERDLETVHRIVDIRNMIKNGANLNVLTNVFLKDYQIKLIPHLNTHKNDEALKAVDLTNKEALDMLKTRVQDSGPTQKMINGYIMRNIDTAFIKKYGDGVDESAVYLRDRSAHMMGNVLKAPQSPFRVSNEKSGNENKLPVL